MKLHDLCRYYTGLLETTNFPNTDYRAEKLKAKFQKHDIGNKISFSSFEQGSGKYSSQLVFSNAIETVEAIRLAYKLGLKTVYLMLL